MAQANELKDFPTTVADKGRWKTGAAAFAVLMVSGVQVSADDPFASPAIDPSLFKEGVIESYRATFEDWEINCQQVVRLLSRVCNMSSDVVDEEDHAKGRMLLATDDAGRPSIMLSVAAPLRLDRPVLMKTSFEVPRAGKKPKSTTYQRKLIPLLCELSCRFVFAAENDLLVSLNTGSNVYFEAVLARLAADGHVLPVSKSDVVRFTVSGKGFADALRATTSTW